MNRRQHVTFAIVGLFAVASCGTNGESEESTSRSLPIEIAPAERSELPARPESEVSRAGPATENLGVQPTLLAQPAIWPAGDVVFASPQDAAASFVSEVLGVDPILGDYMGGDSRSGEIQVFSPGDGPGADRIERGLLGLRMISPTDGWFVIAASSAGVMIDAPDALDRVPAGPLVVNGRARGFEGTVVVTAIGAGDADDVLDQEIGSGGPFAELAPYEVTLDLSTGDPGQVVAIVVRGDTGLDGDPGEFSALPVTIDGLPETR